MDDLTGFIRAELVANRPDSYDPADRTWMDPVITKVAALVPTRDARVLHAEALVRNVETSETRRANKLLRQIGRSGQWSLDWMDYERLPLAVGGERICLGAAKDRDLEQWAIDERRDSAQDFASRSAACDGAEWLAEQMRAGGWPTAAEAFANHDEEPS